MATSSRTPRSTGSMRARRAGGPERGTDGGGGLVGRTMPHNVEAEQGLLASCILDGVEVLPLCLERNLPPEAFYVSTHQIIYESIVSLYEKKTVVDEILLAEELSNKNQLEMVGGLPGINQIMDRIETTAHASYFLEIVRTKYLLRRLIRTSTPHS